MRILGIESSSLVASAAIYEDGITMAEYTVDFKMTHSQTLLPMIDEMVRSMRSRCQAVRDPLRDSGSALRLRRDLDWH